MDSVPADFAPIEFNSPYIVGMGPYFFRREEGATVLAVRAQEKHCNSSGFIHGGFLTTLADVALTRGSAAPGDNPPRITLNLTADFARAGKLGDWLEARVVDGKIGRDLVFSECHIRANGKLLVRASGVLRPVEVRPITGEQA